MRNTMLYYDTQAITAVKSFILPILMTWAQYYKTFYVRKCHTKLECLSDQA
jgi:hypothetical protein